MEFDEFLTLIPKTRDVRPLLPPQIRRYGELNPNAAHYHLGPAGFVLSQAMQCTGYSKKPQNRASRHGSRDPDDPGAWYANKVIDWGKKDVGKRGDPILAAAVFYWFFRYVTQTSYFTEIAKQVWPESTPLFHRLVYAKCGGDEGEGFEAMVARLRSEPDAVRRGFRRVWLGAADDGPVLTLDLEASTDETRFLFRSRTIPFLEPEAAYETLDRFLASEGAFRWHVVYGPGGTGKSRLALEYALARRGDWSARVGFLSPEEARSVDWDRWQPNGRVLMIVDYAAREIKTVARMVRCLAARKNLVGPVRLVLLERDVAGSWFDQLLQRGRSKTQAVQDAWSGIDGALEAPDDVWPIIQHMCAPFPERLPERETALRELEAIDHHSRPLFAAFLGDAYARGERPRNWDAFALVQNVLARERRLWAESGVEEAHINLCVLATATGGIPAGWLDSLTKDDYPGFLPQWHGNPTILFLSAIYGSVLIDDIPPLEPDILGEALVLEFWRDASRFERESLVNYGARIGPWFVEFLERLATDFPCAAVFDLLRHALAQDFGEFGNTKPELLYNVVTNLARSHPQDAISAYQLFEVFDPAPSERYAVECIVDGALNVIVGSDDLGIETALAVYGVQKQRAAAIPADLDIIRSQMGVALSLIAKFPQEEPDRVRSVLADALRSHRAWPDDGEIRVDACVAIANFVNLLPAEDLGHALRLLKMFEMLSRNEQDGDLDEAWRAILYHVLLLFIFAAGTEEGSTEEVFEEPFSKLMEIAPLAHSYRGYLLETLDGDLKGD
ncbi:MAG: hypothetical protein AAF968_14145 [Pseudomonadota bacterium]